MRVQLQQSCDARNVELQKKHDERIKRLAAEVRVRSFASAMRVSSLCGVCVARDRQARDPLVSWSLHDSEETTPTIWTEFEPSLNRV